MLTKRRNSLKKGSWSLISAEKVEGRSRAEGRTAEKMGLDKTKSKRKCGKKKGSEGQEENARGGGGGVR